MGPYQAKQIQQETDQLPTLVCTAPTSCVYVAVLETLAGLNQPSQHLHTQPDISTLTQTVALHVANIYIAKLTCFHWAYFKFTILILRNFKGNGNAVCVTLVFNHG